VSVASPRVAGMEIRVTLASAKKNNFVHQCTYSLGPFLIVACASRKTNVDNYILKNINIYNT